MEAAGSDTRESERMELSRPSARVEEKVQAAAAVADAATLGRLRGNARQFWVWLALLLMAGLAYGFINRFILTSVIVQGRSMAPTLQDGERYLLDRWSYNYRAPSRGDVVVLRDPGHQDLAIKRIVGLPGDRLQVKEGVVFVNGKRHIEPYLTRGTGTYTPDLKEQAVSLGQHEYFVLGDNREVSEDSRYYGPIHRDRIVGCLNQ
jgi:signal peptidase I